MNYKKRMRKWVRMGKFSRKRLIKKEISLAEIHLEWARRNLKARDLPTATNRLYFG